MRFPSRVGCCGGSASSEGSGLIHGWGLSGVQRKVLHNLPLSASLLHHDQVLSKMNDGADKPSRSPCRIGECARTLFKAWLDCFQCAPLIESRLDPLPNLFLSSECTAITYPRGVFGVQCHDCIDFFRVVRSTEFLPHLHSRFGAGLRLRPRLLCPRV